MRVKRKERGGARGSIGHWTPGQKGGSVKH